MNAKELLELHDEMTARCKAIMQQKNSDYTGGENATDALANFKGADVLGIHPVMGLLLRIQDKMKRIQSFVADGKLRVTGETVVDACDDMLNYSVLAAALLQEEADQLSECVGENGLQEPTSLPAGYVEYGCAPLHHRPTGPLKDIMWRISEFQEWQYFDVDTPVHAWFAVKAGTAYANLNGINGSETRNS